MYLVYAHLLEDELLAQTNADNRYYNHICWLTSHNSFAYKDDSFSSTLLHPNQEKNIQEQLLYGVRSFMIDLHNKGMIHDFDEDIVLAHKNDLTGGLNYV